MKFHPQIHFHHFSNPFSIQLSLMGSEKKWEKSARDRVRKTECYRIENNFIEMSNAIQENQQSSKKASAIEYMNTWHTKQQ